MASALCALAGPAFAVDFEALGITQDNTCAALWSPSAPGEDDAAFRLEGKNLIIRTPDGEVLANKNLHKGLKNAEGAGLVGTTTSGQPFSLSGTDFDAASKCAPCPKLLLSERRRRSEAQQKPS